MANIVKILWSKLTGHVPSSLVDGQIAINQKDKKIFYPDETGAVQEFSLVSSGTSSNVLSNQKLSNWTKVLSDNPSVAKIIFVGDSTSDLTGNASSIPSLIDNNTKLGFELEGFDIANMPNYGTNGQTITGFIADTGAKGLQSAAAELADLVIFSYGINDIRANLLTKEQLKSNIITCIDAFIAANPNVNIVLRMPNSFDIPVNNAYIQQGSYTSLAEAAQKQSEILYDAYKELENNWSQAVLFNTQDLIFGRTALPMTSILHTDEIHPQYEPIIAELVKLIGYKEIFREEFSSKAIELSATPWTYYPMVFENTDEFIKIGEGTLSNQGTGYVFIAVEKNDAYKIVSNSYIGDYMSLGKGKVIVETSNLGAGNDSRIDFYQTLPTNTLEAGDVVEFYRSKYNITPINKRYLNDTLNYPYAKIPKTKTANNPMYNKVLSSRVVCLVFSIVIVFVIFLSFHLVTILLLSLLTIAFTYSLPSIFIGLSASNGV